MRRALPDTLAMLADLIGTPSMSSVQAEFDTGNGAVSERLAEFLTDAGCVTDLQPIEGHPGKFNLLARFGSGPSGLALCGHTDTVPYDESRWCVDPFAATRRDEKMYGLGSSDMKGFLAICAAVLARIDAGRLSRSVLVLGSADEESSMSGARALLAAGTPLPPFAVIGEPTKLMPVRQHKGTLMEAIRLIGRSGHSATPALGVNAIDAMHDVIGALRAWRRELREQCLDHDFDVPYPTLNFGSVRGGDNPNRICAECELHVDFRPLPGMTVDAGRRELRERVRAAVADHDVKVEFDVLFAGADPLSTAADSPIVRACEAHTGSAAGSVNFCTEGPFYSQLGAETVIFGPGDIDLAHQPDEYLDMRFVAPAERAVHELITRFCQP